MHGLISLYFGYFIYLFFFFRFRKRSALAQKITIFLGVKLLFLTLIYFAFFSQKVTKERRQENIKTLILK